jgi:hypothetical protein
MRAKKSVLKKLRQISPAEFAVLEMTNNPQVKSKFGRTETVTVTSKEAYVWAALMAHVAENEPAIGAPMKSFVRHWGDRRARSRITTETSLTKCLKQGRRPSIRRSLRIS